MKSRAQQRAAAHWHHVHQLLEHVARVHNGLGAPAVTSGNVDQDFSKASVPVMVGASGLLTITIGQDWRRWMDDQRRVNHTRIQALQNAAQVADLIARALMDGDQ